MSWVGYVALVLLSVLFVWAAFGWKEIRSWFNRPYLCRLIGHVPRGPIDTSLTWKDSLHLPPVLYKCDRCKRRIYFDRERRYPWVVVKDGSS